MKNEKKKAIRKALLDMRRELSLSEERHRKIASKLIQLLEEMNPKEIGSYWPIRGEPNINDELLRWCKRKYVGIYLPETLSDGMVYREWLENSVFLKDKAGIPFPDGKCLEGDSPSVIISPCVGYTENGQRLGYGGGYFDRYLCDASHKKVITIGLAYDLLKVGTDLFESFDIPMDFIVTEERIIKCG